MQEAKKLSVEPGLCGAQLLEPLQLSSAMSKKLARLNIHRHVDLLLTLPYRYEDETKLSSLAVACKLAYTSNPGKPLQVEGVVESLEVVGSLKQSTARRQYILWLRDAEGGRLQVRFFNIYPRQQKDLQAGTRLRLFGEIYNGFNGPEMTHPRYKRVEESESLPTSLTPVYPATAGLTQVTLQNLVAHAMQMLPDSDPLAGWLAQCRLPSAVQAWKRHTALRYLHHPSPDADIGSLEDKSHPAWQRLKFDELLAQQLSLKRAWLARRRLPAPPVQEASAGGVPLAERLQKRLLFSLTNAQQRVFTEISDDLKANCPMQRLLQGDVGAGKTVVAALAICQAIDQGWQAAFMAPTEILAEQHYLNLASWLEPLGIKVVWLSGSQKNRNKSEAKTHLAAGAALCVGTHALIQKKVDFSRLGLIVIDEQHRFGVAQRLALREKGRNPHQLMMSATPIPRTLAMSYYADLDVSVLDELPAGRKPVETKLINESRRAEVIEFVRRQAGGKKQVYWVCPLIEESEALQLQTAVDTHARLCEELPELNVGLVHGRLSAEEKQAAMSSFVNGQTDLLVATTVIEVGVDVANARLMVIEHAERFGLAQLHQLRGRTGRGSNASRCILLYATPLSKLARARLRVIYEQSDGFEIARLDLQIRGPGEFVGSRQSGSPLLRYADLETDVLLIEAANELADKILHYAPQVANEHLAFWLGERESLLKA